MNAKPTNTTTRAIPIRDLQKITPKAGRLEWIGLSPARGADIRSVDQAIVEVGTGLRDDHHARSGKSPRQVTIIQFEHLAVVASILGLKEARPEQLRRNLAVSGINVFALKQDRFRIGSVLFEGTGACAPCSRMEMTLGYGGFHSMRGHGGITARVLEGGTIEIGAIVVAEFADIPAPCDNDAKD